MPVELTQLLSVTSCLIAGVALWRNLKGDTKANANEMTTVIVKLETINENTKEIKADIKDVKNDMERMKERLIKVEQSTKSAHHRLDNIVGKQYEDAE